jgi:hypothetical protein
VADLGTGTPQVFSDEQRAILTLMSAMEHLLGAIDDLSVTPKGAFGFDDLAEAERAARDVLAGIPRELLGA